jgi:hypothetical protein
MLQNFLLSVFSMFAPALKVSQVAAKSQISRFCLELIGPPQTFLMRGAIANKALYSRA